MISETTLVLIWAYFWGFMAIKELLPPYPQSPSFRIGVIILWPITVPLLYVLGFWDDK